MCFLLLLFDLITLSRHFLNFLFLLFGGVCGGRVQMWRHLPAHLIQTSSSLTLLIPSYRNDLLSPQNGKFQFIFFTNWSNERTQVKTDSLRAQTDTHLRANISAWHHLGGSVWKSCTASKYRRNTPTFDVWPFVLLSASRVRACLHLLPADRNALLRIAS